MRILSWLMIFIADLMLSSTAWCQSDIPSTPISGGILRAVTEFILDPWITASLVLVGMALIILEIINIGARRATGFGGVLCLGVVTGASMATGAGLMGGALLLAGLVLLMVESRITPGRMFCGVAGLTCMFLGMYGLLLTGSGGMLFTVLLSAVFTALAGVAFIVHLPTNPAWRKTGRLVQMHKEHSAVNSLETGQTQITEVRHKPTTQQADDDQTTVKH